MENPIDPKEWDAVLKIIDKMPNLEAYERGTLIPVKNDDQEEKEQLEPVVSGENMFEKRSRAVRNKINGESSRTSHKA